MLAPAAANIQPQLLRPGIQSALQRAHDGGRNAGGVPIHAHHRAQGLKPKGVAEAGQHLASAVLVQDGFNNSRAKQRHTGGEPGGDMAPVER
jgi:hypothetical protein